MPLHVPTSSSGAFVLLEGVGDDEDDDEGEDEDEDDDDDDDVLFHGAHAPIRLGCPHLQAHTGPASPRAPPNAKRVLRHYTRLG